MRRTASLLGPILLLATWSAPTSALEKLALGATAPDTWAPRLSVPEPSTAGARRQHSLLTVYAAASLTESFGELGKLLERSHPGVSVRFNFAGSQQLALQLEEGAMADVFASADARWMDSVAAQRLLAGTPHQFARNRLVVIVPRQNPGRILRLEDLARPGIKLVLAAEAVPVGRYSREVIRKLVMAPGFPGDYAERVLANVVSEEENVRSVAAKVQLGEADAGVVYRSDLGDASRRAIGTIEIPDDYNVLAEYPIAILAHAQDPNVAWAFVQLVLGAEGQAVLRRHGFLQATASDSVPSSHRSSP